MKRRVSCADTAKLVRKALRQTFPGAVFRVRSHTYSGGASIDVEWFDGPTEDQVNRIIKPLEGANFDGTIDLETHNDHWLSPDGSVTLARANVGHSYERPELYAAPGPGAELVHFGADYVFAQRHYSTGFLSRVVADVCARRGWEPVQVLDVNGYAYPAQCTEEQKAAIWREVSARAA